MKISRLKEIRTSLNLSQGEFAKLLNISRQAVANYESFCRVPRLLTAYKIIDIAENKGIKLNLGDIYPRK